MALIEQAVTQSGSDDSSSIAFTRTFQVDEVTHKALLEPGIPLPGSSYEFAGRTAIVDSRRVEPIVENPNWSRVIVNYSTNGRGRLPPRVDDRDTNFKSYSFSWVRDTVSVPAYEGKTVRRRLSNPDGSFAGTEFFTEWARQEYTPTIYYANLQVRLNLSAFTLADYSAISQQTGRVHEFGGPMVNLESPSGQLLAGSTQRWMLVGASADQREPNRWEVRYSWIHDPGNGPFNLDSGRDGEPPITESDGYLLPTVPRYEFERYISLPATAEGNAPRIRVVRPFSIDPDMLKSHQFLPGNPI